MAGYVHALTPLEVACGVTLEQVAHILPKVRLQNDGRAVLLPKDLGPALAASVARCALAGPAEFEYLNNGYPVYGKPAEQAPSPDRLTHPFSATDTRLNAAQARGHFARLGHTLTGDWVSVNGGVFYTLIRTCCPDTP